MRPLKQVSAPTHGCWGCQIIGLGAGTMLLPEDFENQTKVGWVMSELMKIMELVVLETNYQCFLC